ncbi:gfo/Idh/MocA family oxidoreductase [Arthrobacter sp. JZ12]|uniref:Gfo/Idh/MocA family protein n=1 Tax=Arthrobacter sp. JZ12 TaxID=2654190 RepID=UPI002B4996FA|nr:Gfo/Idh/MocA family oxidoreductase [Arthrobacter sp. JZ12]WRH23819.1 gfo/Idh/MocA family oxidoreductase [Arthrobacter sp. JZ12]
MRSGPVGVGVIGAGVISEQYLTNLTAFPDVRVHVVADLFPEAAKSRAEEFGVPAWGTPEDALNHPDVEIIVNLTTPASHVPVALDAVAAGKHVWSEKPFSLDRESGQLLLKAASDAGVRLGCAPDTFLGAGLQTGLRMIQRGDIGQPLTALTLMQSPGPEAWHPNPAFLFQEGAGPLFDMGPYYLTTLVQAFGTVKTVAALGSRSRKTRVIGSGPRAGEEFAVTVPTHVSALVEFESGASSTSNLSFDSPLPRHGFVEITGSEATIAFPDPNRFDGEVRLHRHGADTWETFPSIGSTFGRGIGVLDMARATRAGLPHRAQGATAFHVLDVMASITESVDSRAFVNVSSNAVAAEPLPEGWDPTVPTLT